MEHSRMPEAEAGWVAHRLNTCRGQSHLPGSYFAKYSVTDFGGEEVDDFIERLLVNKTLNANPAIKEARARVPKAGLKYQVTSLVCQLAGGPQKYEGRSMKASHVHLHITEKQWDAMVADFKKTLGKFKVPEKEQGELFGAVGAAKPDIVEKAAN